MCYMNFAKRIHIILIKTLTVQQRQNFEELKSEECNYSKLNSIRWCWRYDSKNDFRCLSNCWCTNLIGSLQSNATSLIRFWLAANDDTVWSRPVWNKILIICRTQQSIKQQWTHQLLTYSGTNHRSTTLWESPRPLAVGWSIFSRI